MQIETFIVFWVVSSSKIILSEDLSCEGLPHDAIMTAYFPDYKLNQDSLDVKKNRLRTLQDFLDDREDFVTAAVDLKSGIPYGLKVCIPELNEHFGRRIPIQVRDFSDYGVSTGTQNFSRIDICVRTEEDSYDRAVNRNVTVYAPITID